LFLFDFCIYETLTHTHITEMTLTRLRWDW